MRETCFHSDSSHVGALLLCVNTKNPPWRSSAAVSKCCPWSSERSSLPGALEPEHGLDSEAEGRLVGDKMREGYTLLIPDGSSLVITEVGV